MIRSCKNRRPTRFSAPFGGVAQGLHFPSRSVFAFSLDFLKKTDTKYVSEISGIVCSDHWVCHQLIVGELTYQLDEVREKTFLDCYSKISFFRFYPQISLQMRPKIEYIWIEKGPFGTEYMWNACGYYLLFWAINSKFEGRLHAQLKMLPLGD